jgi:hypothetical protein
MEAARSSKTLVANHHITRRNNPENAEFYLHRRENLNTSSDTVGEVFS